MAIHGADIWFAKDAAYFLPEDAACACGEPAPSSRKRTSSTSGSTPAPASRQSSKKRPELKFPADMYLEGSDQHRGWFHSSLLVSVGNEGTAPYRSVLTHGFVVDGKGRKMSKTDGNVIAPSEIIDKYGAEILRLWVTYEDYRDDIRISKEIVDRLIETYRRIRNTFRFLHANIAEDFDPAKNTVPYEQLSSIDKWLLSRLQGLIERVRSAYETYAFHSIYHSIQNFCTVDLSALYLDIIKDRMYVGGKDSVKRRASQTVVLREPRLPPPACRARSFLSRRKRCGRTCGPSCARNRSIWRPCPWRTPASSMRTWRRSGMRSGASGRRSTRRSRRSAPRRSSATPSTRRCCWPYPSASTGYLRKLGDELKEVFIVSQVEVTRAEELSVEVLRADGLKCERCWQYATDVRRPGLSECLSADAEIRSPLHNPACLLPGQVDQALWCRTGFPWGTACTSPPGCR